MLGTTDTTGIERLNRCSPSLNDWNGWNEFLIRPIHLAEAKCLLGLNEVKRLNVLHLDPSAGEPDLPNACNGIESS